MFTILQGSCNCKHEKNELFSLKRPEGLDCFLLLLVESPSTYIINNISYQVKPSSLIMIAPNVPYESQSTGTKYQDHYIHFNCSDSGFADKYKELMNHPIWIKNPLHFQHYFQQILWENIYAANDFKEENIDMMFQIVLNKLMRESRAAMPSKPLFLYATQLRDCRTKMTLNPTKNFTAAEHAATMNVSPSYFQHLYKELFGIPFKADLINMRLEYAQNLILTTDLNLEQIIQESGFSNESYFYRHFKSKTGMTPRQYCAFMRPVTPRSLLPKY